MKRSVNILLLFLCAGLTSCSMMPMGDQSSGLAPNQQGHPLGAGVVPGIAIGGSVARSMDSFDRVKMNRALDKAPGTETSWRNTNSGFTYTVIPVQKMTINENPYCRRYEISATRNGHAQRSEGTACVAADGAWSEVNS